MTDITNENVDVTTGEENTFEQLLDRTVRCALWLRKEGVKKGDVVAISTHNHPDCFVPCIAALFIGAIFNPWDPGMNTNLARHFMRLTEPRVVFANERSTGVVLDAAKIEGFEPKMVTFGDYAGTLSFADILEGHPRSAMTSFRCENVELGDTALILFSSGTTGLPKGVELSHRMILLNLVDNAAVHLTVMATPLWFSTLCWISGILCNLKIFSTSARKIIGPDFEPQKVCELVEKYKVTWLFLSTSMANRLVRYEDLQKYDLSSLKCLFVGGAILKLESQDMLREYLPHALVAQGYGMTELGGAVASQNPKSTSGSCGTVSINCEMKIVDVQTGKSLGPNQQGELCVKSSTIMNGYHKNPTATKEILDKDGWIHTGDLAYYNDQGEMFIVDRIKEIVKYRGYQITPSVIEDLLQTHPGVVEVAVVGVPHPTDDEHLVAFVCKAADTEVSANELIAKVENNFVDAYRLRGGVKFLSALPYTATGKIARAQLRNIAKSLAVH
ncbi:uncharacterized protein LOC117224286 isoform X3 [Megalopta genalis]|uniref:uncharacterized protein LOC117224286 isoform X3 n=1 Tax=Megalopta genalis TaxID=115081 RepID=UPI003FD09075